MILNSKKVDTIFRILPGIIVCVIIAMIGKYIGNYIPSLGGASLAIFIGMAVGNTFCNNQIYDKGTKFAESELLSYSIVLLGGTLSAQTIFKLGVSGITFIVLQMLITIICVISIGKKLGFSDNFSFLMASGNAVCGSSAIAATVPVIEADDNDKVIAITIVNVTGTVLMLILPLIANIMYSSETVKTSALIGGILQSVGQVVASGSLVNGQVKDLATIFKIVRIVFLIFVLLSFGAMKKRQCKDAYKSSNAKIKVPWYVLGFLVMCSLYTIGIFGTQISNWFKLISSNFEIIALAGIGMRVKFSELIKLGKKASIYACGVALIQIMFGISLIKILL